MNLLGYDVPLGLSCTSHRPEQIADFVAHGFTCFEVGIPAALKNADGSYELCRGCEEKLVETKTALFEAIEAQNLCTWSVHLPFGRGWDIAHYDEEERDAVVESLKRVIMLTKDRHPRIYVLHGCLEPVAPEQRPVRIARSIQSMRELDAFAQKFGARIALEDLPRSCLANSAIETRAMMLAAEVPICFDVNHLLGDTHENFLKAMATNIVTTHLSDYDGIDERHRLPGEGIVPWKEVFIGMQKAGYRGPYLFELKQGEDGPYDAETVLNAFKAVLEK